MQRAKGDVYMHRSWWARGRHVLVQGIGLAGFAIFVEGIRQIYQPAALVIGGGLVVVWTVLKVRSMS